MDKSTIGKVLRFFLSICIAIFFLLFGFILFLQFTQAYYSSKANIIIGLAAISSMFFCSFYLIRRKQKSIKRGFAKAGIFLSLIFLVSIVASIFTVEDRLKKNMKDIGIKVPTTAKPILVHDVFLGSWVDYYPVRVILSIPKEDLDQLKNQLPSFSRKSRFRMKDEFWKFKMKETDDFYTHAYSIYSGGGGYVDILIALDHPTQAYVYFDIVFE